MADVEWEVRTIKPDRGRISELEREVVQRRIREQESAMRAARSRRITLMILIPLSLLLVGAGIATILDYTHVIHIGIFPLPAPAVITPPSAAQAMPVQSGRTSANLRQVLVDDAHAPEIPAADAPVAAVSHADPQRMIRARDRADHAAHGITIISDDIAEEQRELYRSDQALNGEFINGIRQQNGYRQQLASAQLQARAAWNDYNASHSRQSIQVRDSWDAEVTRCLKGIDNETEITQRGTEHVRSLQARLEKAQQDLVQSTADYVTAGGGQQAP